MANKPTFVPSVRAGDAGCLASVEEFGIEVGVLKREQAEKALGGLLQSHCRALLQRGNTSGATPEQMKLAKAVIENGFEFHAAPKEPAHKVLMAMIENLCTTDEPADWLPPVMNSLCGVLQAMVIPAKARPEITERLEKIIAASGNASLVPIIRRTVDAIPPTFEA